MSLTKSKNHIFFSLLFTFLVFISFFGYSIVAEASNIYMPDANLRKVVNNELGKGMVTSQITKSEIEKLTHITCMEGGGKAGIKDLTGLEHAKNLWNVCLNDNDISDLTPLKNLTNIKNLYIGNNKIKDISPLKNLVKLERLSLWKNEIEDISVLKDKTDIYYLLLYGNKIKDISPLKNLSKLEELSAYNNLISDIEPLKNKPNLVDLRLHDNDGISDLSPISNSAKIEYLTLNNNKVKDITPLKNMSNLEYLAMSGNLVENLSPLSNKGKLYFIAAVNNNVTDLTPLKSLTNLEYLSLSSNNISDVSQLSGLTNLSTLRLVNNKILDLSPVYNLNIQTLTAQNQKVTLPDILIGETININLKPEKEITVTFNDGKGTFKNGELTWTEVNKGTGDYTITWTNKDGNFTGTITQKVFADKGEVYIKSFQFLGDEYLGDDPTNTFDFKGTERVRSNKFFEGDTVEFRFTVGFDSPYDEQKPDGTYRVYSGPVYVKFITDEFEVTEYYPNISLWPGSQSLWLYSDRFEKQLKAAEVSGKDFKEILKSFKLEVIPTRNGIIPGEKAIRSFDYYTVNRVYDISIDSIIEHDEYPIPGEDTNVKLKICNNGNQEINGYTTEIMYNGQKMTTIDIDKLGRGAYVSPKEVNSNCTGVSINTKVPELYDPNALVEFEAEITPKENVTEITINNNHISATFEQGVGPEPIYVCDDSGELIDVVYNEGDIVGGSPDNCKDETGQIDPGPDVGDPINEIITEVPLDEEYFYEPENTDPVNAPIAKQVSGNDFKEETENIFVQVNRDGKHPKDDINKSNDKKIQKFKSVNKVYDLSAVKVTKINPAVPKSNEDVKVTVKVCNEGNQNILDYKAKVSYKTQNRNSGEGEYKNISRGPYNNIDTIPNCKEIVVDTKMFDIEDPEESFLSRVVVQPMLPSGEAERNTINNVTTFDTLVRNPNASVFVRNTNDNKDVISETGGVSVVVNNNMFRNISAPCKGDCLSTNNTTGHIKIKDMLNGGEINIPVTYSDLEHSKQKVVDISKPILNYIKGLENKDYEVIEFKIEARIPHYKHEVDYSGQPKYDDNVVVDTIHYFPPRPNVSIMKCTELGNPAGYFAMNGGEGPIKTCAGHYPNNPSTAIEKGMQAYHYVMHRFFPAPMPKYEIKTPAAGEKHSPHYFNQIYKLEEPLNEMGDEDTFLFANKDANGIWKERGRYLPTGATFKFEVKEKQVDGRIIAAGSIHYDIPNGCYQTETLDMKHQYGCDEIMFFVPNVDNKDNFVKEPKDYEGNVSYPLGGEDNATTKIPYLNPGLYEFKVEAEEAYKYHYQINNGIDNEYYWSKVKK